MTFGEILFSLRNEKLMSRETLAALLGISADEVYRLERDEIAPTERQLKRIAEIFDLDAEFFMACSRGVRSREEWDIGRANSHISFGSDGFAPVYTEAESKRIKKLRRKRIIFAVIDTVLFLSALAIFLVLGFTEGLWHPAWTAFPLAAAVVQLMYVLGYKRKLRVLIIDCIWLFSAIFYLFVGIFYDEWSPSWMIFIIDIVVTAIVNAVFWLSHRNK